MPPSNSKSSTDLESRADSESRSDRKPGRSKPSKDSPQADNNVHFEPFHKRAFDMSYACLLIPRNPSHELKDKVADFIDKNIRDTCRAFGWSLGSVQVRSTHVQWVVNATLGTPPSKCIHTIREQTSKGILGKFKDFREKDKYQDFWAPGYLVLVSAEAHPQNIIDEFIKLTRQQQGLPPQGGPEKFE